MPEAINFGEKIRAINLKNKEIKAKLHRILFSFPTHGWFPEVKRGKLDGIFFLIFHG
jgi:hypothetical protein